MENDVICYKCGNEFHHSQSKWILEGAGAGSEIDVCPRCESDDLHDIFTDRI